MHSFHAFIDEPGDEGFKFKEFPEKGSSEWFVVSACVVRESNRLQASRALRTILDPIEAARKSPVHFANLPHDTRVAITIGLAKLPIRIVAIAINKRKLPAGHTLDGTRRLHFYSLRLLLERISWIARDHAEQGVGDGRCQLTFSHCKHFSYTDLESYFKKLQGIADTKISWGNLDHKLKVLGHNESLWLRAADIAASSMSQGLELSRHGYCEPRYAKSLKPCIYHIGNNYFSYGLKFMPGIPAVEKEKDNRYEWLSFYKN